MSFEYLFYDFLVFQPILWAVAWVCQISLLLKLGLWERNGALALQCMVIWAMKMPSPCHDCRWRQSKECTMPFYMLVCLQWCFFCVGYLISF